MKTSKGDAIWLNGFLVVMFVFSVWLWFEHLTFEKLSKTDFRIVSGVLEATSENGGSKKTRDIHLQGQDLIYRIPIGEYRSRFSKERFINEVSTGDTLELSVINNEPQKRIFSEEKIQFVRGVKKGRTHYSKVEEYLEWTERNNGAALLSALLMTTCFVFFTWIVHLRTD